jgi:hypothetical protein
MADAPVRGERSVVRNMPLSYSIPPGAKSASAVVRNLFAGVITSSIRFQAVSEDFREEPQSVMIGQVADANTLYYQIETALRNV